MKFYIIDMKLNKSRKKNSQNKLDIFNEMIHKLYNEIHFPKY